MITFYEGQNMQSNSIYSMTGNTNNIQSISKHGLDDKNNVFTIRKISESLKSIVLIEEVDQIKLNPKDYYFCRSRTLGYEESPVIKKRCVNNMVQNQQVIKNFSTMLQKNGFNLDEDLNEVLRKNTNYIKNAPKCILIDLVRCDPSLIEYASDELKKDVGIWEIILDKLESNNIEERTGFLLEFFGNQELQRNKDLVLMALKNAPYLYRNLDMGELKKDLDVIKCVIDKKPDLYKDLPEDIKENIEVSSLAINKDAHLIQFAPNLIKDNRKIIEIVVKNKPHLITYASDELKKDVGIWEIILDKPEPNNIEERSGFLLEFYGSQELQRNKDLVLMALKNDPYLYRSLDMGELKKDLDVIKCVIDKKPDLYKNLPEDIKGNIEVSSLAIDKDAHLIQFAPNLIKDNRKIIELAVKNKPSAVQWLNDKFLDREDIIKLSMVREENFANMFHASDRIKKDPDFAEWAIQKNALCWYMIDDSLKEDERFLSLAVIKNPKFVNVLTEELKEKIQINLNLTALDKSKLLKQLEQQRNFGKLETSVAQLISDLHDQDKDVNQGNIYNMEF